MEVATPIVISFAASFYLLAALTLTSFIKITIVLLLLRNAIGIQQVPSGMIVMALSLFLSAFISLPVFTESGQAVMTSKLDFKTVDELATFFAVISEPFQRFVTANLEPENLAFFVDIANKLWEGSSLTATGDNFFIQVPAFMISELNRGFQIGFAIYLPFIAIDLAITTILMALGMQMVQPNIIAAPFKLLLFIFVDGWTKLVEGLLMSYNYA